MIFYLLRRLLYAIPILIGVNFLTFILFFSINSPNDMARMHLGNKYVTEQAISNWKQRYGYDKPLFYNSDYSGKEALRETLFFQKSVKLMLFDFGRSDAGRDISHDIFQRMMPSLLIAVPAFILSLMLNITFAMVVVFFRGVYIESWSLIICIMLMSISSLFYIIVGQYIFAKMLRLVPVSGYADGLLALKFALLLVVISILASLGSGIRWYRTLLLEEYNKPYVICARAKGLSEIKVLFKHVLRNTLLPIVTGVVVVIPSLFMGSLLLESFFSVPGLGSYTLDAINQQDFAIVRAMVYLGTVLYIFGLVLTDMTYVLIDPRVRLNR